MAAQPALDYAYADASSVELVDSEVLAINASGVVPVEVFNRIESQESETERERTWDEIVERLLRKRAHAWEQLANL